MVDLTSRRLVEYLNSPGDDNVPLLDALLELGLASSSQGELAETALQPDDIGTSVATGDQGRLAETALQPGASADSIEEGGSHLFFSSGRVLGTVLAGLSLLTGATITASDTVIAAFGKLQKQLTDLAGMVAGKESTISAGTTGQYYRGDKTWQALNKAAVGLENVDNTSDAAKPISSAQQAALDQKVGVALVGAANGVAGLDSGGRVPASQLPSYVDDVQEFASFAGFPTPGETGKIYVAIDTNFEYRWSGSAYIRLVASPGTTDALAEGVSNLYFTGGRVLAVALAGLSTASNAAITVSDTVLAALGKLQAQISGLSSSKLDATATAAAASKLAVARNINGVAFDGTSNITISDSTKEPAITAGTTAQFWRGDKTWQPLNKGAVGLGNVDNTSDATKPISSAQQTALDQKLAISTVGAANGVASLDSNGQVPAAQLAALFDWNN